MRFSKFNFIIFLLFATLGCRTVTWEQGKKIEDDKLLKLLQKKLETLFPKSFRVVHRAILTVEKKQFVMDGYLLIKRPNQLRVLSKGTMGGTLFDVVQNKKGEISILDNSANFQPSWIVEGALKDGTALYLNHSWPNSFLLSHKNNTFGLARKLGDSTREEFIFQGPSYRLMGYIKSKDGQCLYRIEFSEEKLFSPWPKKIGRTIKIKNYVLNYSLTLQVIGFKAVKLQDKFFVIIQPQRH